MSAVDTLSDPMPPGPDELPGIPSHESVGGQPRVHVLLVDDEVRNLDVLESVLESPEYGLVRATTADAALLALIDGEFAAIVLDIQLPGMSGLELAHLVKQRKRTRDVPIIFLTAYFPEEKFVLEGYHAGAVDYLTKPVNPQILRSKVHVFVDLYRKTRALAEMNRALAAEVDQRRQAEEALRLVNSELEERVEERTSDLVAASRAKDDFLAALSHELRTPLNPALMIASEAAEDPGLPASARADFATIRNSIELEAGLIDDLLDLTRITRGKLAFERRPLDIHGVLRQALLAVQPEVERRNLVLELDLAACRLEVDGDAIRLQQVFWNVLRNAAKFTSESGRIHVSSRNDAGAVIVSIADNGIGMSRDELDRIFHPFAQGDHAVEGVSRQFGGLGLGLSIARRLVEHHGGCITAFSDGPGQGATLEIKLPLSAERESPPDRPAESRRGSRSSGYGAAGAARSAPAVRILLVEDHTSTRQTLVRLLSRRGHRVKAAANVAEALVLAADDSFDLLVSDIGLPDGDGCNLMEELRRRHPNLPGIALSGYGMEKDVARSRAVGFARHFIKPVDVLTIDRAIAELFAPRS